MAEEPIQREPLDLLLVGLQSRGLDAAGIAIVNPPESANPGVHVFKDDEPAWTVVSSKKYEDFMKETLVPETQTVILHTRAATKGSPRENKNNHPMFVNDVAVVHNGIIGNDDYLFRDLKLERGAETDSDILRAILDEEGFTKKGIRVLGRVTGSVALAAISASDPEKLLLLRSGSPLILAEIGNFLTWASEKSAIHSAFRPWINKWGMTFQKNSPEAPGWLTFRDHTAWLVGPKGLEWHDECKTCYSFTEPRRAVFDNYQSRNAKWDTDTNKKVVLSPDGGRSGAPIRLRCFDCKKLNKLNKDQYNLDVALLNCGHCNKPLVQGA